MNVVSLKKLLIGQVICPLKPFIIGLKGVHDRVEREWSLKTFLWYSMYGI